jgi:hypothetical protein
MSAKQKRWVQRTQFVINRGFQLRYIGVLVSAALVASLIIGGVLYYIVEINWAAQVRHGLNLAPESSELMTKQRHLILLAFISCLLLLGGILSLWGVFLSHRIAGPVFALSRRMNHIVLMHDMVTPLRLRKMRQELNLFISVSEQLEVQKNKNASIADKTKSILRDIECLKKDKEKWLSAAHS